MRTRKPTDADARLENLLPLVQDLPEEQRRNLADFLEALLKAHRFLKEEAARQPKPKKL